MTTIFCTGSHFSNWQSVARDHLGGIQDHVKHREISALNDEVCALHARGDDFGWAAVHADEKHLARARALLVSEGSSDSLFFDQSTSLLLDFWRAVSDQINFVLFYSSPEYELCEHLKNGAPDNLNIDEVITTWAGHTEAMLTFFLNHRDSCLLIDVEAVDETPDDFISLLVGKFGISFEERTEPGTARESEYPITLKYLATSLLLGNDKVSEIYDEVRSTADMLSPSDKKMPSTSERGRSLVPGFMAELSAFDEQSAENDRFQGEIGFCHLQISQLREELETSFVKSIALEETNQVFSDYLSADPLLRVARKLRLSQANNQVDPVDE